MPSTVITDDDFTDGRVSLSMLLVKASLCPSNSEAKRNIKQGGISVNDSKITDFAASFDKSAFEKDFIIKKGKKDYHKIILK